MRPAFWYARPRALTSPVDGAELGEAEGELLLDEGATDEGATDDEAADDGATADGADGW